MLDIILDTLLDSVKLLPFLFITYLLMEELEHKTGGKAKNRIRSAGKSGPVWGALLGVIHSVAFCSGVKPLCGTCDHSRNTACDFLIDLR